MGLDAQFTVVNPFVWGDDQYQRDFNHVDHYIKNSAKYLSVVYGVSADECEVWVKTQLASDGEYPIYNPKILTLTRPSEGNRILETITAEDFFGDIIKNRRIVSPSLAVYLHPKEKQSILAKFIRGNVKARGVAKKAMFLAKQLGDKITENIKNDEQASKKIANNSMSGAHNSLYTILWMRSAHSSLTSTCRTATAYANANNEKFLTGNRHYYDPTVTMEALVSTLNLTDFEALAAVMEKYQLHYPTAEEVLETIRYSADYYWPHAHEEHKRFFEFAARLEPIERAALVYVQDAWHLKRFNEEVMRTLISKLITYSTVPHPDPAAVWSKMTDSIKAFVFSLHGPELMGKVVIKLKETDPELYACIASTAVKTCRSWMSIVT